MRPDSAVKYPVTGVTLHRVSSAQRSRGDGEEQAPQTSTTNIREATQSTSPTTKSSSSKLSKENKADSSIIVNNVVDKSSHDTTRMECEKNEPACSVLPEVLDIAQKLTKVSVTSIPDSTLLNTPPKDLHVKKIIPIHPKNISYIHKTSSAEHRRKDPKFVPYEPYKGCITPITGKKSKKEGKVVKQKVEKESSQKKENNSIEEKDQKNAEELNILVKDFEKERSEWEQTIANMKVEMKTLENQVNQVKKEKKNLESQLSVQSQINTELKKLLVASVGEDVQGRVQCLTEDKARMATMIRRYSERVDRDYEEKERIGIQCDVWRSKFLGSSMLVDELVGLRVGLTQQLREAGEALKLLLEEHSLAQQHVLTMYRMNKQLRDAFDPLATASHPAPTLSSADLVTLAVDGAGLAETVRDRLLGDLGRAVGDGISTEGLETQTPGLKIARQLLSSISQSIETKCQGCSTLSPSRTALIQRFHPNVRLEHLTVNCCSHCNGEIIVV